MAEYNVPNRAVTQTIIASKPINENWENIEEALNKNYNLASQVENKIDKSSIGAIDGVASLDINAKLTLNQLPDSAKGHVYEVSNLSEQLSLTAYSGDICVRSDINKTYVLSNDDPSSFANWIEIATMNAGGEIGANPCYTNIIKETDWVLDETNDTYSISIDNLEHGQGNTRYLLVDLKNTDGTPVYSNITIDENGVVTITSLTNFEAYLMISNLSGNVKNIKYIPYTVISGATVNDVDTLLSYSINSIHLITSPSILLVDGLDYVRNVSDSDDTTVSGLEEGEYVLFIDSANITNEKLSELTYILKSKYLGVVSSLPSTGSTGDRCYVAYDKSYEYSNGNWVAKAFVPIGEFYYTNNTIDSVYTYKYRNNGIDVNYRSNNFDYLYGKKIEGMEITIDTSINVTAGKCYSNVLMELDDISKNYDSLWEEGNNLGCFDSSYTITEDVYEVEKSGSIYYVSNYGEQDDYVNEDVDVFTNSDLTGFYKKSTEDEFMYNGNSNSVEVINYGWGYIFAINNEYNTDIILSFNETPSLPTNYTNYRRIGYFYKNTSRNIKKQQVINGSIYFTESEVINGSVNFPANTSVILLLTNEDFEDVNFYSNNMLIRTDTIKTATLTLPNSVTYSSTGTGKILGYIDERES